MAKRNTVLDEKIISAAREDFLAYGYHGASLHKIAQKAGVTTGALYTRYTNKDDLFKSLVVDALDSYGELLAPVHDTYLHAQEVKTLDAFLDALNQETEVYFQFLEHHREACVLLFCKSDGSALGEEIRQAIEHKITETVLFFEDLSEGRLDSCAITTLMRMQFSAYRDVMAQPLSDEEMARCMESIMLFLSAGWKALFSHYMR